MNQEKFISLREKYPNFIYNNYTIIEEDNNIKLTFEFIIEGLVTFNPYYIIKKEYIKNNNIDKKLFKYLVFHIGLIEMISYFKCTCSKNIIIKAGYLNDDQINWIKKLCYYGLGEMLYTNGISISYDEFVDIKCNITEEEINNINYKGIGNLIPIGGGKDSIVTLEILKKEYNINDCFIINPKDEYIKCCSKAGYNNENIFIINRYLDKKLLKLNEEGYLNGHTPFSSLVAFVSYLCAYLSNKKYIVLSNEASANEPTILNTKINHQYSKTYEFENDFNEYTKKYFKIDIKYFSLLRCLSELNIANLFSNYKKYHVIFKSCNVGMKTIPWKWCCNCPKCLFVYIILSPFLSKEEMINIFGIDLFEQKELLNTFIELTGYSDKKPFECVGTYSEVRTAVGLVINKYENDLPYLLKYYKDNYKIEINNNYRDEFNIENNIPEKFIELIKEELKKYV